MRFKNFLLQEASDSDYMDFLKGIFNRQFVRSTIKTIGFVRNYTDMNNVSGILLIDSATGKKLLLTRPLNTITFEYPEFLSWLLKFGAVQLHDKREIEMFIGAGFANLAEGVNVL